MRIFINVAAVFLAFRAIATDAAEFKVSSGTMAYSEDHNAACVAQFGEGAKVADWDSDVGKLSSGELAAMMAAQGISKGSGSYWVTSRGKQKYTGSRSYFFEDHDGRCPSNWLVHSKKDDLCLGSWRGNRNALCLAPPPPPEVKEKDEATGKLGFQISASKADHNQDHNAICQGEFGKQSGVADWNNDLAKLSSDELSEMMLDQGIGDGSGSYWATYQGKQKYTGSRAYFFTDLNGKAPRHWLVHGVLGDLVMGSWQGYNHILCKAPVSVTEDVPEVLDAPTEEGGQGFTVSLTKAKDHDDHAAICAKDFGESSSVADWTNDLAGLASEELAAMMVDQGIKKGSGGYWINDKDKPHFSGTRAFFFEDHDGNCPSNWLVHDKKDDLCLGSWHGSKYVLCKTTEVEFSETGEGDDEEDEAEGEETEGDEDGNEAGDTPPAEVSDGEDENETGDTPPGEESNGEDENEDEGTGAEESEADEGTANEEIEDANDAPTTRSSAALPAVTGDPHFAMWSGKKFDFHGGCDLVLVHNPDFNHGQGLFIHIRTKIQRWWSFVESVVVQIGSETLEVVGAMDASHHYFVNGRPGEAVDSSGMMPFTIGGFSIRYRVLGDTKFQFKIFLDNDQAVVLKAVKDFMRVDVHAPTVKSFGKSTGLLGSFEGGQMLGRDGVTVIEDPIAFGKHWQVQRVEPMLFHNIKGPQHPEECVMPDLEKMATSRHLRGSMSREEAAAACAKVTSSQLEDCIFDVMATDDVEMAGAF